MNPTLLGIAGFVLLLLLMSQRVPVAIAMIAVGLVGLGDPEQLASRACDPGYRDLERGNLL